MLFYEIKISYTRQTGEDTPNAVKETYLVEGLTCSDVETRLLEEIKPFISGEWEIKSCKQAPFRELIPDPNADYWYKARVEMITVEDNGKETRKGTNVYVQGNHIAEALKNLQTTMQSEDCEIISISKSPILEVFRAVK